MLKRKNFYRKVILGDYARVHNCVTGDVFEFNIPCIVVLDFIWNAETITLSDLKREKSIKGINYSDLMKFLSFLKKKGFIETDNKQGFVENKDRENALS